MELAAIPGTRVVQDATFAELTTLRVGGTPRATVTCESTDALVAAVRLLDDAAVPLLVVGGGSNLVVADGQLDLVAVCVATAGLAVDAATGLVRAEAGVPWDQVVAQTVAAGLGGLECLSGIPGSAGATPVQNVGAYGAEIADVLTRVELYDRRAGERRWVPAADLELGYRYSNLKFTQRAVVLQAEYQLRTDGLSAPLRFGQLARTLGATEPEQRFPAAQVRRAVLDLRRTKGMVLDSDDHDTWSAGSFFTNPVVDAAAADAVAEVVAQRLGSAEVAAMPRYPAAEPGMVKLSAAWLIERAGFPRGYPGEGAPARLSTRHTLALTNRGQACTADVVALAQDITAGVGEAFGVRLVPEPVWVGFEDA